VRGLQVPAIGRARIREVVVGFDGSGRTVADVNAALRERGILGGRDLSRDVPWLGQAALYAVTEAHGQPEIDRLADALAAVLR
jgi:glycine dehydrogenase subunit 1